MKNKFSQRLLAVAVASGLSASAWAIEPQSIPVTDGVIFTPTLKVSEAHDSNIHATRDNRKSSWITTIAPSFQLNADARKSGYQLKYTASRDIFHSQRKDDNTDHYLNADAGFRFNSRNKLDLGAGYTRITDTTSSTTAGKQNRIGDKYSRKSIGGTYTYGADTARMQLETALNYDELRYHGKSRSINRDKERDTTALRSTFYYSVAPKTRVLLEGRYTDYDYDSYGRRDAKNIGLLAGVTWDATAKTSGYAKLGREKKKFDRSSFKGQPGYKDKSMGMWEVGTSWQPLTYSTFNLSTRRGFDEGDDGASTIKTQSYNMDWKHYWLDRLYSNVEAGYSKKKYQYDNASKRDDKLKTYGVGVTYEMRRWLDIGLGYSHNKNTSDIRSEEYKRNIYALTINASL